MNDGYYIPGPDRAERVRALFSRIAPKYDLINDLQSAGLHRLWKRRLIHLAEPTPAMAALDVCCGTGDIVLGLERAGAFVIGCDFTLEMLQAARRRSTGLPCIQADALHVPFPDETFDIVTVGYGLRNLASLSDGVAELLRVIRPGGRLLVLEFGKPPSQLWRRLYFAYLRLVVPLFGRIFCGDARAYSYILESLERYPGQAEVSALLEMAGGEGVRCENILGGVMSLHITTKAPQKARHFASATMYR